MIPRKWSRTFAALALASAVSPLAAATKTWDLLSAGNGNGVIDNGAGTWGTTPNNWTTNSGTTNVAWADGDDAVFGGNNGSGNAGTITLSANRTAASITFNNVSGGSFSLTGNQIIFGNTTTSMTQNSSSAASIDSSIKGDGTTLTLGGSGSGNLTINGAFSQTNSGSKNLSITKSGSSTFTLTSASSSYSGATAVNGGTLVVNGTLAGGGAFNVNNTGKVAGTGTISKTVSINTGGTLSPGNDGSNSTVGQLSTNGQTWAGNSNYTWEIKNATAAAGTGYDTVAVSGTITVSATNVTGNKVTIKLVSHGAVANWNPLSEYHWDVATATSVSNFSADKFVLDTTDFADDNPVYGTFTVDTTAGKIRVNYIPEPTALSALAITGIALMRRNRDVRNRA